VSAGRTLKGYLFWTYERGSFHYDVMVTLILAFIFVTPHLWNYGDHPQLAKDVRQRILVQAEPQGVLVYDIPASQVTPEAGATLQARLVHAVAPISGEVVADRYEVEKDSAGHVAAYRLWAHR
jgi:hypothetical protein